MRDGLKMNELQLKIVDFNKELIVIKNELTALFDRYGVTEGVEILRSNGRTICSVDVDKVKIGNGIELVGKAIAVNSEPLLNGDIMIPFDFTSPVPEDGFSFLKADSIAD